MVPRHVLLDYDAVLGLHIYFRSAAEVHKSILAVLEVKVRGISYNEVEVDSNFVLACGKEKVGFGMKKRVTEGTADVNARRTGKGKKVTQND